MESKVVTPPVELIERASLVPSVTVKVVVVAFVVVEFNPVKFCRVVEPVTRRLGTVRRPVEVMAPAKRLPKVPVVA